MSLDAVLGIVGHDGSEITHAGLPEPLNRRGFHPQEMIKMCLEDGMAVTRVELFPQAQASSGVPHSPKRFNTGEWDWFKENLNNSVGVIECRTSAGLGHAMAYEGRGTHALICDPGRNGDVFEFHEPEDTEQRDRFLVALWRIENILP